MNDKLECLKRTAIVLPSLDPDAKFRAVVEGLLDKGFEHIVIVNDGSAAENLHWFEEAAQHENCVVLHHEVNKGKGRALKNAFNYVAENLPEVEGVITIDGDGQHLLEDIVACGARMLETADGVVLGCRDFNQPGIPPRSVAGNKTTSRFFHLLFNIRLADTQTGLRAIPRKQLEFINTVSGDRFEYETNMLLAMKENGIDFDEVKIRTVYIEENKSSHFRVIHDSWRIYKLILKHFFRYTASSLISSLVDTVGYAGLSAILKNIVSDFALTAVAGVSARVISSLLNFFMNKKLVFNTNISTGKAMARYFALAIPQMAAQVLLTQGIYSLLSIPVEATFLRTLVYVVVMTILFVLSYIIQQRWVFAPQKEQDEA